MLTFSSPPPADCTSNLWAQEAYCVLAPTTATATTTSTAPASTTSTTAAVTPPAPTQSGIPANCNKYAVVSSGGCYDFAAANGITLDQLCKSLRSPYIYPPQRTGKRLIHRVPKQICGILFSTMTVKSEKIHEPPLAA